MAEENCIFCNLAAGNMPTAKIGENERAIAILELNPVAEGHAIVIPKNHTKQDALPKEAFDLAKETGELLKKKLGKGQVRIVNSEVMEHGTINIIPFSEGQEITGERQQKTPEELEALKKKLLEEPIEIKEKVEEITAEEDSPEKIQTPWLPQRKP